GFVELTNATLFDRNQRFLNPFWKMTGISIPGNGATVTINVPPSGRDDDPFRAVILRQGWSVVSSDGGKALVIAGSANAPVASCARNDSQNPPFSFDT